MSIYKTRMFGRWARKQGIQDSMLCHGFAKSERASMDDEEVAALKAWTKTLLSMPPAALAGAEEAGEAMKVDDDA